MLEQFLARHSIIDTLVLYWIFSAAVSAMPEPGPDSHGLYSWLYFFLKTLVGHLSDAMEQRRAAKQAKAKPA